MWQKVAQSVVGKVVLGSMCWSDHPRPLCAELQAWHNPTHVFGPWKRSLHRHFDI